MSDPVVTPSVSVVGVAIAVLGPVLGPFAVIAWAALAGASWPLSKRKTKSRMDGAWFLARMVVMALLLTLPLTILIQRTLDMEAQHIMGIVALLIGLFGDRVPELLRGLALEAWRRWKLAILGSDK